MVEQIHDQGIVGAVLVLEQFLGVGQEFFLECSFGKLQPQIDQISGSTLRGILSLLPELIQHIFN